MPQVKKAVTDFHLWQPLLPWQTFTYGYYWNWNRKLINNIACPYSVFSNNWQFLSMKRLVSWFCFMVFNATFNNISVISWRSVLFGEGNRRTQRKHRPAASHWQTLSHNVLSSTPRHELATIVVIGTDCTCSCKCNYHTTTTRTTPV